MPNSVKIFAIGDVVGKVGRATLLDNIEKLKEKYKYDIVVCNVENASHGSGINLKHYKLFNNAKIDVMTTGNHAFGKKEIYNYILDTNNLLLPANIILEERYDNHKVCNKKFGKTNIKFINLIGDCGVNDYSYEDAIEYFEKEYSKDNDSIYIVDFHGEYSAEKKSFAFFADGKASLVFGTHTHVQTADEQIMPKGCAYITDVGMCGAKNSVIGYPIKDYFKKRYPKEKYDFSSIEEESMLNAVLVEIDLKTKKAKKIERINVKCN